MPGIPETPLDLLIVGGGVNGAGIARDAAGRGLSVLVCEQGDLAGATSSASTKLIHGGLRYLEHYEFRLVREALAEREVLLALAPHIIRPLRFVLPHAPHLRPAWMIRVGMFLYDRLGGRKRLPGSSAIDLTQDAAGQPLQEPFRRGFVYSDCWVDDARLVVLNAVDAADRGAVIRTRTRLTGARRDDRLWRATLRDAATGADIEVAARILVNVAGPWVHQVVTQTLGRQPAHGVRLVKGSHIVVPKLFEGAHAYIFQNPDRRVVFAIPYEGLFTLIGTTDLVFEGDPARVAIDATETAYLCEAVSRFFRRPVTAKDVVWSFAGVRPLYDDGKTDPSAITRDYVLDLDAGTGTGGAPALSVYGGKITTYRRLAEQVLDRLRPHLPELKPAWTATVPLPGGDIADADFDAFAAELQARYPELDAAYLTALGRRHGTRARTLLGDARAMADLGDHFGGGLFAREVDWQMRHEWARDADDVLWRRTKCGLHMNAAGRDRLARWMAAWNG